MLILIIIAVVVISICIYFVPVVPRVSDHVVVSRVEKAAQRFAHTLSKLDFHVNECGFKMALATALIKDFSDLRSEYMVDGLNPWSKRVDLLVPKMCAIETKYVPFGFITPHQDVWKTSLYRVGGTVTLEELLLSAYKQCRDYTQLLNDVMPIAIVGFGSHIALMTPTFQKIVDGVEHDDRAIDCAITAAQIMRNSDFGKHGLTDTRWDSYIC